MKSANDSSRHNKDWIILGAIFLALYLLLFTPWDGAGGDPCFYHAYVTSALFDGDLQFSNDLLASNNPSDNAIEMGTLFLPSGYVKNPYALGTALLAAPFYVLMHLLLTVVALFNPQLAFDRYSQPYLFAISFAAVSYVFVGLLLTYSVCRRYFSRRVSLLSVLAMFVATPLLYYALKQGAMSHAFSFFASALFVWATLSRRRRPYWSHAFLFGIVGGLLYLVRWQNVIFFFFPLSLYAPAFLRHVQSGQRTKVRVSLLSLLLFALGFLLMASLQSAVWYRLYGTPLTAPQGESFFRWTRPQPLKMLFSGWHGFFTSSPIFVLTIPGFVALFRSRARRLAPAIIGCIVLMIYVNSAISDWFSGSSFGVRRVCSALPFFAIAMCASIVWLRRLSPRWLIVALVAALCLLNVLLVVQVNRGNFKYFFFAHEGYAWSILLPAIIRHPILSLCDSLGLLYLFQGRRILPALLMLASGVLPFLAALTFSGQVRLKRLPRSLPRAAIILVVAAVVLLQYFALLANPRSKPLGQALRGSFEAKSRQDADRLSAALDKANRIAPDDPLVLYFESELARLHRDPEGEFSYLSKAIESRAKFVAKAVLREPRLPIRLKVLIADLHATHFCADPFFSGGLVYVYLYAKEYDAALRRLHRSALSFPEYYYVLEQVLKQADPHRSFDAFYRRLEAYNPLSPAPHQYFLQKAIAAANQSEVQRSKNLLHRLLAGDAAMLRFGYETYGAEGSHWEIEYYQAATALAHFYTEQKQYEEARKLLRSLAALPARESRAQQELLDLEFAAISGLNHEDQLRRAEEMVAAHPDDPRVLLLAGSVYAREGQPAKAMELYMTGWQRDPRSDAFFEAAINLLVASAPPSAWVDQWKTARIEHYGFYQVLGNQLLALGRYKEAKDDLERAIDLNPVEASLYFSLGIAQQGLGEIDKAIESLRKSAWLDPYQAHVYLYLARCYLARGDRTSALEACRKALALEPNNPTISKEITSMGFSPGALLPAR